MWNIPEIKFQLYVHKSIVRLDTNFENSPRFEILNNGIMIYKPVLNHSTWCIIHDKNVLLYKSRSLYRILMSPSSGYALFVHICREQSYSTKADSLWSWKTSCWVSLNWKPFCAYISGHKIDRCNCPSNNHTGNVTCIKRRRGKKTRGE